MTDFKKLRIWQLGMDLVKSVYALSAKLPQEEKYGIRSQITRAAVSIPSNIAEGSSRFSERDYLRFLEIALGSAFELETQLLAIEALEWIPSRETDELLDLLTEEQKMIRAFINRLRN